MRAHSELTSNWLKFNPLLLRDFILMERQLKANCWHLNSLSQGITSVRFTQSFPSWDTFRKGVGWGMCGGESGLGMWQNVSGSYPNGGTDTFSWNRETVSWRMVRVVWVVKIGPSVPSVNMLSVHGDHGTVVQISGGQASPNIQLLVFCVYSHSGEVSFFPPFYEFKCFPFPTSQPLPPFFSFFCVRGREWQSGMGSFSEVALSLWAHSNGIFPCSSLKVEKFADVNIKKNKRCMSQLSATEKLPSQI